MVVQDRNYAAGLSLNGIVQNLFGVANNAATGGGYLQRADYTLLPINPTEPGRFNVIRDFKMYVAPGWRQDYYKKITLLQRDLLSKGRIYTGTQNLQNADAPGDELTTYAVCRNGIYLLFLYQSPTLYGVNTGGSPDFTISVQTRFAYYDN